MVLTCSSQVTDSSTSDGRASFGSGLENQQVLLQSVSCTEWHSVHGCSAPLWGSGGAVSGQLQPAPWSSAFTCDRLVDHLHNMQVLR